MPVILDTQTKMFHPVNYEREADFESDVVKLADHVFGSSSIYIDIKKRVGNDVVTIGAAMKDRIKYIAAYRVAPISAVTHIAEILDIKPYKDTGKYVLIFKGPAQEIEKIRLQEPKNSPQGPVYTKRERLLKAKTLEDALKFSIE